MVYYVLPAAGVYLDDVETRLELRAAGHKPVQRRAAELCLLRACDELARLGKVGALAQFDLHDGGVAVLFRNDVYLAVAAGVVEADYLVALTLEVAGSLGLALAAYELGLVHQCIFLKNEGRCAGQGPSPRMAA